jgi:uncharacterized protein YjbI with pentapeptide repeats
LAVLAGFMTVWPWQTVLALSVAGILGLLAIWIVVVPRRLAPPVPKEILDGFGNHRDRLEVTDARIKLRNDLRTTAMQALAGLAVLAGAVLGFQQLTDDRQQANATRALTLQGQASERFTRAIDQLGSNRREVQIGGIYGLEQIAQQAPDNRLAVTEVLVAYLHRRIPKSPKPHYAGTTGGPSHAPDAQAALTVLGRRQTKPDDPPVDLASLDLSLAALSGANLRNAGLSDVDLREAILSNGDLRDAWLAGADLRSAWLDGANLSGATLDAGADLRTSVLEGAILRGAFLYTADFRYANLRNTDLTGADLRYAKLSRLHLDKAKVRNANLYRADLRHSILRDADLDGSNLCEADLRFAILDGAKLRGAKADEGTKWPKGFNWHRAGISMMRAEQCASDD